MSYYADYSYYYSSGDDSFSYISDPAYCPVHSSPPCNLCTYQQPYSYYNNGSITPNQVNNHVNMNSSVFQVRPEKNRRFTPEQIRILEEHFYKVDKYLSKVTIDDLSTRTQLKPAQIRIWFNNKRTRERHS